MVIDSTLKFATRRNVPVRYNRDLVAKTLQAMDKVAEIRKKRERVFYMNRMKGNKERQRVEDRKLVEENQHLLPPEERTVVPEVTIKGRSEPARAEPSVSMARRSISQLSLNFEKSWMKPVWITPSAVTAPLRRLTRSSSEPR